MKKIMLLITVITCAKSPIFCQWLTQSADSKGTFLFKGANVTVDVAKANFSFTINNLNNPVKAASESSNHQFVYGGGINAKSEEGLGDLFSKGNLVPAADANGYLGVRFANSYKSLYDGQEEAISEKIRALTENQISAFQTQIETSIDIEIDRSDLDGTNDAALIKTLKGDWKTSLKNSVPKKFLDFLKSYLSNHVGLGQTAVVSNIIADLLDEIKAIMKVNEVEQDKLRTALISNRDGFIRNRLWRFAIFTFGGIQASSFKRVESINTVALSKSFIKEDFRGGNWGMGLNYQISRWRFGGTYSYQKTNNFDLLDKSDYKLTTTVTSGNETLTQEKAITAYSGNYGEVEINEFNLDVLYSVGLGKSADAYALINPYLRDNLFTRDKKLLPNSYNIGLGTYFYTAKSKFLGGLYVELPDVNDSMEKSKPATDQNIRPAIRRLTFGIIAKLSLNSLISWQ